MVEIHEDNHQKGVEVDKEGGDAQNGATPSKPKSRRLTECDYSSTATASEEIPAALRQDPQVREYLRQLSAQMAKKDRDINALREDVQFIATTLHTRSIALEEERHRSLSPRRTEGKNGHVRDRLGHQVAPYDERLPSLSPVRFEIWRDPKDRLRPPMDDHRRERPAESCSFYDLSRTVSHEFEIDRQRDQRHRENDQAYDRRCDQDHRRVWSPLRGNHERRGHDDHRRPEGAARQNEPTQVVSVVPVQKAPQTKVEMVLEQLVSSPFTDNIETARLPKNFTATKFTQYDPKTRDAMAHLIHYQQMMSLHNSDGPLMCKMFPSSLGTRGLLWFNKLPSKSISSYKALSALFLQRFVTSQKQEKDIDALL